MDGSLPAHAVEWLSSTAVVLVLPMTIRPAIRLSCLSVCLPACLPAGLPPHPPRCGPARTIHAQHRGSQQEPQGPAISAVDQRRHQGVSHSRQRGAGQVGSRPRPEQEEAPRQGAAPCRRDPCRRAGCFPSRPRAARPARVPDLARPPAAAAARFLFPSRLVGFRGERVARRGVSCMSR